MRLRSDCNHSWGNKPHRVYSNFQRRHVFVVLLYPSSICSAILPDQPQRGGVPGTAPPWGGRKKGVEKGAFKGLDLSMYDV